jgi:hypothetical protein
VACALGLVAAVAAAFVALGSTSNPTVDPIAQAATASSNARGFRMNMRFAITSPQLGGDISASGTAVVDPPDQALSMSLEMDLSQLPQAAPALGSTPLRLDMILDGHRLYVRLPAALTGRLPGTAGKPWVELDATKSTDLPGLSSLGVDPTTSDPTHMLQELMRGASGVTNEGQQNVDGVQTTHYRGELNLDRLLPNVPSAERALLQQFVQGQEIPIDVWVDAHHLVRRVNMFLALSFQNGPALQETVSADFSGYGPQPRPTPPPADQVTELSSLTAGLPS